jgi:hypothetical protein
LTWLTNYTLGALGMLEQKEQALARALLSRLHSTFAAARAAGLPESVFDDTEALADAMVSALPVSHIFDQKIGPFYDTAGLIRWLGTTRQALAKRVQVGTLIACQLEDRQWVYPTWQFTTSGALHPGLADVWKVLRTGADPWTCALWLRTPAGQLGSTAVDAVIAGRVDDVLRIARIDAARWAA